MVSVIGFFKNPKNDFLLAISIVFVVVIGLLFIIRGLGLGIPYLSPSNMVTVEQASAQHSCH